MGNHTYKLAPGLVLSLIFLLVSPAMAKDESEVLSKESQAQAQAQAQTQEQEPEQETGTKTAETEESTEEIKDPTVEDLKKFYDAGNYRGILNSVKKMKPTMMTHYYTGLAYQATNQSYRAAVEFNHVKINAKDPQLKYNASVALKSVYSKRRSTKQKRSHYDDRDYLDSYARHSDKSGPSGGGSNQEKLEMLNREMQRAKLRRKNQDRYFNSYRVPKKN